MIQQEVRLHILDNASSIDLINLAAWALYHAKKKEENDGDPFFVGEAICKPQKYVVDLQVAILEGRL